MKPILLDATLSSTLNWTIPDRPPYFWQLEMGLFEGLSQPLETASQFLSFKLALEHFRDTVWIGREASTLGVSLYQGFMPSREQLEYLKCLRDLLPDELPVYLCLDLSSLEGSELQALNPETFRRFHLALKGAKLPWKALVWEEGEIVTPQRHREKVGLCIPSPDHTEALPFKLLEEEALRLQAEGEGVRLIAESSLTTEWEELDALVYCDATLSYEGRRMLQGFAAAGGVLLPIYTGW